MWRYDIWRKKAIWSIIYSINEEYWKYEGNVNICNEEYMTEEKWSEVLLKWRNISNGLNVIREK